MRKKSRKIVYIQIETDAIEKAKAQFKAKKERKEQQQRKLPPVLKKQDNQARSLSVQPPLKCLSAQSKKSMPFTYFNYIGEGKNHELIKKLLDERQNWVQVKDVNVKNINFKWQETEKGYEYRTLVENLKDIKPQMLNHFEQQAEISNKHQILLHIVIKTNQMYKIKFQQVLPQNVQLKEVNQLYRPEFKSWFISFFNFLKIRLSINQLQELDKTIKSYQFKYGTQLETKNDQNWGVSVDFKTSEYELRQRNSCSQKSIRNNRYQNGQKEHLLEVKRNEHNEIVTKIIYINTLMTEQFVTQKYIEKPLLIKGRKFDIRTYVLITSNLGFFFFKEGQLRLATETFDAKQKSNYVHLTNNAIQYSHPQHSKTQEGNQYNFDRASQYFKIDFRKDVSSQFIQGDLKVKIDISFGFYKCLKGGQINIKGRIVLKYMGWILFQFQISNHGLLKRIQILVQKLLITYQGVYFQD